MRLTPRQQQHLLMLAPCLTEATMSKLDLRGFRKVDANRDHTVMENAEGHRIFINHKSITKEMHDALRNVPVQKLYKGGVVAAAKKEGPKAPGTKEEQDKISEGFRNALGFKKMADGGIVGIQGEDFPMADPNEQNIMGQMTRVASMTDELPSAGVAGLVSAPTREPVFAPSVPQNVVLPTQPAQEQMQGLSVESAPSQVQPLVDQYTSAVRTEADAAGKIAKEQEQVLARQNNEIAQLQKDYKDIFDKKTSELNNFKQYIENPANNVQPGRLMANQSTYQRIATSVGLALGGAPARAFVERQIEDDIKMQQQQVDNKKTLYSENMKLLGDKESALQQTRLMMYQIVENDIKRAALKQGTPTAQANALKLATEFQLKAQDYLAKETERETLKVAQQRQQQQMQGLSRPVSPDEATNLITSVIPEKQQLRANEELAAIKGLQFAVKDAEKAYKSLEQVGALATLAGKAIPGGTKASRTVDLANAAIERIVRQNRPAGSGVLTDKDAAAIIEPYKLTIADLASPSSKEIVQQKKQAFNEYLQGLMSTSGSTLSSHGIKVAQPASLKAGPTPRGSK
jgi:hypothetical protein